MSRGRQPMQFLLVRGETWRVIILNPFPYAFRLDGNDIVALAVHGRRIRGDGNRERDRRRRTASGPLERFLKLCALKGLFQRETPETSVLISEENQRNRTPSRSPAAFLSHGTGVRIPVPVL